MARAPAGVPRAERFEYPFGWARPESVGPGRPARKPFMDPAHLKKLVETLERSGEIQPMEPDSQAYAQAVQQLQELDGILASMRAVYRQAAQELNIPLD